MAPHRDVCLVADNAYINAQTLRGRPANLRVLGPVTLKAALHAPPQPKPSWRRGRQPSKGERLPSPRQMFALPKAYPARVDTLTFPGGRRRLRVQVVKPVLWYTGCKAEPVQLVLVRDPGGAWQDLALLCTDVGMTAQEAVAGYCRRLRVEVLFHDSKHQLGLQDPQVRAEPSVQRAHPLAWFSVRITLLWYTLHGGEHEPPVRERPWYRRAVRPAFAEMLGTLRLALWRGRYFAEGQHASGQPPSADLVQTLLHCLATVR
jgi:hypothetical protein